MPMFVSFLCVAFAVLIAGGIWLISRPMKRKEINEPDKRFMLPHEYVNKGFIEKSLSDGVRDIATSRDNSIKKYSDDPFFKSEKDARTNSEPGDE